MVPVHRVCGPEPIPVFTDQMVLDGNDSQKARSEDGRVRRTKALWALLSAGGAGLVARNHDQLRAGILQSALTDQVAELGNYRIGDGIVDVIAGAAPVDQARVKQRLQVARDVGQ